MGKILIISTLFLSMQVSALEIGDILLQPLKCWTCTLIEQQENSDYSHIGIYVGYKQVAEAYFGTVKIVSLDEYLSKTEPGQSVRVRRLKTRPKNFRQELLREIDQYIGLPYDRWFLMDDEKIYCSELVYKAFNPIVELKDTYLKPMLFDQNPEYWDRYFRGQTPRGELGISPEDFNLSSDFITVEELPYVPAQKN